MPNQGSTQTASINDQPPALDHYQLNQVPTTADGAPRHTLLLVDDNETIRTLLTQSLTTANYTILTAEHGAVALELLNSTPIDLVLLDVMMPVMDGFRTCAEIRKRSTVPIIFLSSLQEAFIAARIYKLGANAYLPKASAQAALLACIRSLLPEPTLSQ